MEINYLQDSQIQLFVQMLPDLCNFDTIYHLIQIISFETIRKLGA